MNLVSFLCVLFMIFDSSEMAKAFLCFHCHQTSKDCNSGIKMNLNVSNCTTHKCFVLKYETEMPGIKVLATFRGCYHYSVEEMMKHVVTDQHAVTKKYFHICNHTLCNKGTETFRLKDSIQILFTVQMTYFLYIFGYLGGN
ncbi:uncharacterized protein LOC130453172 [Diorhabda sublineata]|uniref:uncharacterized protein LOC130453172 n=1 Tax=Diorhabda sublineata TaxID=1163346 RepID=UPI0024E07589|nr:uncharacterized protein LOC130453172 [Diorhabda sublineata]